MRWLYMIDGTKTRITQSTLRTLQSCIIHPTRLPFRLSTRFSHSESTQSNDTESIKQHASPAIGQSINHSISPSVIQPVIQSDASFVAPVEHVCSKCFKHFNSVSELEEHSKSHNKQYKCEICDKKYVHRKTLDAHLRTHSELLRNDLRCEECDQHFSTAGALSTHRRWKHDEEPPQYSCDHAGCEKSFRTQHALTRHQMKHLAHLPFACPYCGERFQYRSSASKHSQTACPKRLQSTDQSNNQSIKQSIDQSNKQSIENDSLNNSESKT